MRELDEFFASQIDQTLFHYTGIAGLLGIASSRCVWASHAYYLNDSREILHACDVLKSVLPDGIDALPETEREFITQFINWLPTFEATPYHIYIFSLSEQPSLLSQWRSYTPHGKGVSLGFSSKTINAMLKASGSRIAKCLYERTEHIDLMSVLKQKMLITFRHHNAEEEASRNHPSQKYFAFFEDFRGDLLQVLSVIKHSAFKEEAEWRIVSQYYPKYMTPEIKFREGASMLLPYIELALPAEGCGEVFDKVVLGPTRDNNLSHAALSNFLSNKGLSSTTVSSRIPYRKW